jgi:hypothetical protein
VRPELVEQPDRVLGVRNADVDVESERRLAAREVGHRALDDLVATRGRDQRLVPQRRRMRAGGGDRQAQLRQFLREPHAQVPELGDRVADPLVRTRRELDRGLVGLRAHVLGEPGRQPREDLVTALRERPVLRIEEHHLLLEPDRVRRRWLPGGPLARGPQLLGLSAH